MKDSTFYIAIPSGYADIAHIYNFPRTHLHCAKGNNIIQGFIPDSHLVQAGRDILDFKVSVTITASGINLPVISADVTEGNPRPVNGIPQCKRSKGRDKFNYRHYSACDSSGFPRAGGLNDMVLTKPIHTRGILKPSRGL